MIRAPYIALLALTTIAAAIFMSTAFAAPEDHPPASELTIVGNPPAECYVEVGKQSKAWFEPVEWKLTDGELGDVLKALSKINCRRYLVPKSLLHEKVHVETRLPKMARPALSAEVLSSLARAGFDAIESMPIISRKPAAPEANAMALAPPITDEDYDKAIHCKENKCTILRSLLERLLENTTELATQARIVPSIHDGKPNGFKLYAIRPNAFFGRIGLQNGDTIQMVNGSDLSSPDKALEVYTKLRTVDSVVIEGERRGAPFKLELSIQ